MELRDGYPAISALNAEVLAVSTDELSQAGRAVDRLKLQFPVLYDVEGNVVRRYGLYNELREGLPAPSTFLLDLEGKIQWKYLGRGISDRPSIQRIIAELERFQDG